MTKAMEKYSNISTHKRLGYVRGYLALGSVNEATLELEKVEVGDREAIEVRAVRVELHVAAKQWELVLKVAAPLCEVSPENEGAWIAWASALRKLQRVKEAEDVLLKAESFMEPSRQSFTTTLPVTPVCRDSMKRQRNICPRPARWTNALRVSR